MDYKDITIVLIDDMISDDQPPFQRLKDIYKEIVSFSYPEDGVNYIKKNISNKIIVVLDYQFDNTNTTGTIVLKEIRENISYLIPVIILTEKQLPQTEFPELINYKINYFAIKSSIKDITEKLKNAADELNNDVSAAIEEWINLQAKESREQPYMISAGGKEYTLNQILKEVRNQTDFGKEFIESLYSMVIHWLAVDKDELKNYNK